MDIQFVLAPNNTEIGALIRNLEGLGLGQAEPAVQLTIRDADLGAAVARILDAAGQSYQVVWPEDAGLSLRASSIAVEHVQKPAFSVAVQVPTPESIDLSDELAQADVDAEKAEAQADEAKAQAKGDEPATAVTCEFCNQPPRPKSTICGSASCRKQRQARWAKENAARKKAAKANGANKGESEPSDAELQAAEAFAQQVIGDPVGDIPAENDGDDDGPDLRAVARAAYNQAKTDIEAGVGEHADAKAPVVTSYMVIGGDRDGDWLTTRQVEEALAQGRFSDGQLLRHKVQGLKRVVLVGEELKLVRVAQEGQLA